MSAAEEWTATLKRMFLAYALEQEWEVIGVSDRSITAEVYSRSEHTEYRVVLTADVAVWNNAR